MSSPRPSLNKANASSWLPNCSHAAKTSFGTSLVSLASFLTVSKNAARYWQASR